MKAIKKPAAGVVLRNDQGKYLLIQENWEKVRGLWNLPAGIQDEDETLEETAVRESFEEVGFEVKVTDKEPLVVKNSDRTGRALYSFKGEIVGGALTPQPEEVMDVRWFSLKEIEKMLNQGKIRDEWAVESIRKVEDENHRN